MEMAHLCNLVIPGTILHSHFQLLEVCTSNKVFSKKQKEKLRKKQSNFFGY
jgi:hypothetical protein